MVPDSSSYSESIFSTVRNISTDGRHNLGKDTTQGHASTNVYTKAIYIRNNLLGIVIPKINIFGNKLACYEWEPIECILAQAKSTTYKSFQARKKL